MRYFVVLAVLALGACQTPAQMEEANLARDDRVCRSYGVAPGTNPYVACRMNLAQTRTSKEIADSQDGIAMMGIGAAMMQGARY